MKHLFLIILISINSAVCLAQIAYKQTRIPLDNLKGVPFSKIAEDYNIDGFEIDAKGNFYFSGGVINTIAVFAGDKLLYRKSYNEFDYEKLYIYKNYLYVFNSKHDPANRQYENNLFVLNIANGAVIKRNTIIGIKNSVNSYFFIDTNLIVEMNGSKDNNYLISHLQYDLSGKFNKELSSNVYNLPFKLQKGYGQFLGKWNNSYLFCSWDSDKQIYKFSLLSSQGISSSQANISSKLFGQLFYENPKEDRKLRNESVFILGREGKNALVTEVPIKSLFGVK